MDAALTNTISHQHNEVADFKDAVTFISVKNPAILDGKWKVSGLLRLHVADGE